MNRITLKTEAGYSVSDEQIKAAVQRLGEFEDAYDALRKWLPKS